MTSSVAYTNKLYLITSTFGESSVYISPSGSIDIYVSDSSIPPTAVSQMSYSEAYTNISGLFNLNLIPKYITFKANTGTPEIILKNCILIEMLDLGKPVVTNGTITEDANKFILTPADSASEMTVTCPAGTTIYNKPIELAYTANNQKIIIYTYGDQTNSNNITATGNFTGSLEMNTTGGLTLSNSIVKNKGDIKLVATGDVNLNSVQFGDSDNQGNVIVETLGDVTVNSVATLEPETESDYKGAFYGNLTINSPSNVHLLAQNGHTVLIYKNLYINASSNIQTDTLGEIKLQNVRTYDLTDEQVIVKGYDVIIQNAGINDDIVILVNTAINNANIQAVHDISLLQTYMSGNSTINAGNKVTIAGTLVGSSDSYTATVTCKDFEGKDLQKGSYWWESVATVFYATLNVVATNSISINSESYIGESFTSPTTLKASTINISNFGFKTTRMYESGSISLDGNIYFGNLDIEDTDTFTIKNTEVTGPITTTNVGQIINQGGNTHNGGQPYNP